MTKHEDMDYPHAAIWCEECFASTQQQRIASEMMRANDLKERELALRETKQWEEQAPRAWVRPALPARPQQRKPDLKEYGSARELFPELGS